MAQPACQVAPAQRWHHLHTQRHSRVQCHAPDAYDQTPAGGCAVMVCNQQQHSSTATTSASNNFGQATQSQPPQTITTTVQTLTGCSTGCSLTWARRKLCKHEVCRCLDVLVVLQTTLKCSQERRVTLHSKHSTARHGRQHNSWVQEVGPSQHHHSQSCKAVLHATKLPPWPQTPNQQRAQQSR